MPLHDVVVHRILAQHDAFVLLRAHALHILHEAPPSIRRHDATTQEVQPAVGPIAGAAEKLREPRRAAPPKHENALLSVARLRLRVPTPTAPLLHVHSLA